MTSSLIVSVAVDDDLTSSISDLQMAVDELVDWSDKWGMILNVSKTKVMLFGNSKDEVIELWMHDEKIEQVSKIKYLGVWLDQLLNFSGQVDYVICKAKRSTAKVCTLFDGREGISVPLGVQL